METGNFVPQEEPQSITEAIPASETQISESQEVNSDAGTAAEIRLFEGLCGSNFSS
jgi:hypothetical protein